MSVSVSQAIEIEIENRMAREVIGEVRTYIAEGKAVICPCCEQHAMMNTRKITPTMALQLIRLCKIGRPMHAKEIQQGTDGRERMYSLLRFWGLVEKTETSRWWAITEYGKIFVLGIVKVPKFAFVFNNTLIATSDDELVTIQQCLGDEFNLEEVFSTEEKLETHHIEIGEQP